MENNTDSSKNVISIAAARKFIAGIKPDQVCSVYSGRPGCMCGCRGNHRYHPKHVVEGSKRRGYDVSSDEVSSRSVAIILNKVKNSDQTWLLDDSILCLETENRTYAVYLTDASYM